MGAVERGDGNVGVLIGLFLVAYEVRQTNAALDRDYDVFWTDVQGRSREGWREFNGRIIESAEVADIWMRGGAGEDLSPVESQRFRYLANDVLLLYQQMLTSGKFLGGIPNRYSNGSNHLSRPVPGCARNLFDLLN